MLTDRQDHRTNSVLRATALAALFCVAGCCPSPEDTATELQDMMVTEATDYAVMNDRADLGRFPHAGDTLADMSSDWSRTLSSIRGAVHELTQAIGDSRSVDRNKAMPEIAALRPQMEDLLSRNIDMTLQIPSWRYTQIVEAATSAQNDLNQIRSYYSTLAGYYPDTLTSPAMPGKIGIIIIVDSALRDTFSDCISAYASQDRLSDHTCRNTAIANCTHQMDMQCVNTTIRLSVQDRPIGQAPCYDTVAATEGNTTVAAPWLAPLNFQACHSSTPVLNASGSAQ